MDIITDKSGLLHFLKGVTGHPSKPFTETFLASIKKDYKNWYPFENHNRKFDKNCYALFQHETGWIEYIRLFATIAKYVANDPVNVKCLEQQINDIERPELNSTSREFKENLDKLIHITTCIENRINAELKKLTCLECERIGEAIICNNEMCFTACTVMAASAVEARLHYLISQKNKKLYNQYFKDKTLGTIIKLFDANEYKDKKFSALKKIVPARHKSLLDIVNTYRILSAHPILPEIDYKVAESVINLTFLFLLDHELRISNKKVLSHK